MQLFVANCDLEYNLGKFNRSSSRRVEVSGRKDGFFYLGSGTSS